LIASPTDARRQVEGAWIAATQQLNPGIGADDILPRTSRIEIPHQYSTARAISADLMDRLRSRTDTMQTAVELRNRQEELLSRLRGNAE
jgi:hypothetical protein